MRTELLLQSQNFVHPALMAAAGKGRRKPCFDNLPGQLLLGLGAGKKVPSWNETKNEFVPKTEAQITLSFDHRSIDGGGASRLLKRVIEMLETPKEL